MFPFIICGMFLKAATDHVMKIDCVREILCINYDVEILWGL